MKENQRTGERSEEDEQRRSSRTGSEAGPDKGAREGQRRTAVESQLNRERQSTGPRPHRPRLNRYGWVWPSQRGCRSRSSVGALRAICSETGLRFNRGPRQQPTEHLGLTQPDGWRRWWREYQHSPKQWYLNYLSFLKQTLNVLMSHTWFSLNFTIFLRHHSNPLRYIFRFSKSAHVYLNFRWKIVSTI